MLLLEDIFYADAYFPLGHRAVEVRKVAYIHSQVVALRRVLEKYGVSAPVASERGEWGRVEDLLHGIRQMDRSFDEVVGNRIHL
uniref:HEPN domain-containing protein n=1 Tax=Steinernema glaseri TaxID=37863 RepID=A0A1I7YKI2_9BILA